MILFFVGWAGLYFKAVVLTLFIFWFLIFTVILKKMEFWHKFRKFFRNFLKELLRDKIIIIFLIFFLIILSLNTISALAPELGYDALWYHLTLPKIWLMIQKIAYIPGGALYYSLMPRLGEIFFSVGLSVDPTGTVAKLIHLVFGIFWLLGCYLILKNYLSRRLSWILCVLIYGTFLVSWLSQTAYIDLIVAYFVAGAIWALIKYFSNQEEIYLILAGVFIGFNLASKIYGLFICLTLIIVILIYFGFKKALKFSLIALIFGLPFYLQAYLSTGNPVYPVFSIRDSNLDQYLDGYHTLKDWYLYSWWRKLPQLLWRQLALDFTPIFGVIFLILLTKGYKKMLPYLLFFALFFLLWSLIPVQENRYFMPALPVVMLLTGFVLENFKIKGFQLLAVLVAAIFLLINTLHDFSQDRRNYRKALLFASRQVTRQQYLNQYLPLSLNFYDAENFFARTIKKDEKVLTVQIGNMFYVNFPFWDWSFMADRESYLSSAESLAHKLKSQGFDYVLLGKLNLTEWAKLPKNELERYFDLIYEYEHLKLYRIK